MKYRKSRYTPDFKLRVLTALDASGGGIRATAQQFGIAYDTLADWNRQRADITRQANLFRSDGQLTLEARFDMIAQLLLNTLPEKIENAKLTDTLRAGTMLSQVRQTFADDQKAKTQRIEQANEFIEAYFSSLEEALIRLGAFNELEAFIKAWGDVYALLSAPIADSEAQSP